MKINKKDIDIKATLAKNETDDSDFFNSLGDRTLASLSDEEKIEKLYFKTGTSKDEIRLYMLLAEYNIKKSFMNLYVQPEKNGYQDELVELLIKQNEKLKYNAEEACSYLTAIEVAPFEKLIKRIKDILQ